jgi:hypothetical protein
MMRPVLVLVAAALAGCAELPLPPEVESGGEPGAAVYTASGELQAIAYRPTGRATYVLDDNGQAALSLSPDFTLPAVPRVSIFLSNSPDLGSAVKVGELKAPTGAQRWTFKVPRGAVWTWAVLWSEELGVGVARAPLRTP